MSQRSCSFITRALRSNLGTHVEAYARRVKATRVDDVLFFASRPEVEKIYPRCKGFEFHAHVGPVYALDTSPFERNAFLTGGADGEIRLYSMLQSRPLRVFDVSSFVYDISWSPNCPMVFAAATMRDGIQIFDLTLDMSEPIHRLTSNKVSYSNGTKRKNIVEGEVEEEDREILLRRRLTSLSFNPKQRSLLASGSVIGTVSVYKLPGEITSERPGEARRLGNILNDWEKNDGEAS